MNNIEAGYIKTMDITVVFDYEKLETGEILGFYYGMPNKTNSSI